MESVFLLNGILLLRRESLSGVRGLSSTYLPVHWQKLGLVVSSGAAGEFFPSQVRRCLFPETASEREGLGDVIQDPGNVAYRL